ncbi:sulfate permease-like transporter, MFS superfamily [Xenococcus sp. PCC 7305]|uniref:SulP family inorganic anion transporter n=1 Tax=Xenococcus sp. PCC 7305 TaxID=102125 RepID=UPI0002AC1848|nr:SulP family inorganic anion transporter [Xenococcus sp. PCC 7305]ELS03547.1 sulfate permease-like transporter, MFS superfamily [Xenococcus sp. PCC 7305]
MQLFHGLHSKNMRGDIFGGLTAAIVALPLALAFGVSSGAGAIAGLYGAVFVGFFAALFGGTPSQISGPTGPMTVVMASVFTNVAGNNAEAGFALAFTVVMLGGIFQIIFGILQLGKYITLIPYTVVSGFMSGIGVIIILIEIGPFLGQEPSAKVVDAVRNIPLDISQANPAATILGVMTLIIVFGLPTKFNRIIPSPLLALFIGTLTSLIVFPDSDINIIGKIPTGLPSIHWPVLQFSELRNIIGYGLMLATLGSIDSLLTSLVADSITRTNHDSDQELIGQGIGNVFAGLFGGLPGAGATMRTVINVKSGGKTPISGMFHALILFLIVVRFGVLTENIPHAVLAGILIKVGIDIIDWSFLKRAHQISIKAAGLMYLVMFLTVFVDLITAVGVGIFVANLLTVKSLSDLQKNSIKAITTPDEGITLNNEERYILKRAQGKMLLLRLGGPMSFGAAKSLSQRMGIIGKYDVLILDFREVPLMGVTASLAIENMVKEAIAKRRVVFIVGAKGTVRNRLMKMKILQLLPAANILEDRLEALQKAYAVISNELVGKNPLRDSDNDGEEMITESFPSYEDE